MFVYVFGFNRYTLMGNIATIPQNDRLVYYIHMDEYNIVCKFNKEQREGSGA